jgi:hypothetical protein
MDKIIKIRQKLINKFNKGELIKEYFNNSLKLEYNLPKIKENEFKDYYTKFNNLPKWCVFEEIKYKNIGSQKIPTKLKFNSFIELAEFIGKKTILEKFFKAYQKDEELKPLLSIKPTILLNNLEIWDKILKVKQFFKHNSLQVYIRALPIKGIDTKFIEQNKKVIDEVLSFILQKEPLKGEYWFERKYNLLYPKKRVRIRLKYFIEDMEICIEDIKKFKQKKLFIIENLQSFLAMPLLDDYILVFGKGYFVDFIKEFSDYEVVYWSDIDIDGYNMLSMIRNYTKVESFCMDFETFDKFKDLAITYKGQYKTIPNLTNQEQKVLNYIRNTIRLEQERIPFDYVLQKLKNNLSK